MELLPEDGSLEELTASALDLENIIIVIRSDEFKEPGETTYTLATCDRTKEGMEWPGDTFLEKIIPSLPKVKVPVVNKPVEANISDIRNKYRERRKCTPKPIQRNSNNIRRSKAPRMKFRRNKSENPNSIHPWIRAPWSQPFPPVLNAVPLVGSTPMIPNVPFGLQNSNQSHSFVSSLNNIYNFNPNNSDRHTMPTAVPNNPFVNNHLELLKGQPPANSMSGGPSFQPPRNHQYQPHSDGGFSAPTQNIDAHGSASSMPGSPSFQLPNRFLHPSHPGGVFSGPNQNIDMNVPTAKFNKKQGLLGDHPLSNVPRNRPLPLFPNGISDQSNLNRNTSNLPSRTEENISDQNSFISNAKNNHFEKGPYDGGYSRNQGLTFDQYKNSKRTSGQNSHSYVHSEQANDSFRDANKPNFSRYHNSDNHYENQYETRNGNLDHNSSSNRKNISLNNSREYYKRNNFRGFENASAGFGHHKSGYSEIENDKLQSNSYKESQSSNVSKTSFLNKQARNPGENYLIHLSDGAVVYNFENDGCPASSINSTSPDLNQQSGHNIRRNTLNKNSPWRKRGWMANKRTNFNQNRAKYNKGQQKHRNWRTHQK